MVGFTKDLWLDEVWALRVATEMPSALSAFTLHHEINHHLNTIWLYLVGPNGTAGLYHLPSYLLGVASVAIAGAIGFRRGPASGLATMAVFALSYELVLYSTEARGYAGVVCWTLLAFYALERIAASDGVRWRAIYWVASVLGMLSHPIFAGFLGAAAAWSAWRAYAGSREVSAAVREIVVVHAVPIAALAFLWLIDLREVVAGGGTPTSSLIDVYGGALAWSIGTTRTAAVELVSCILAVMLVGSALRSVRDDDPPLALFFGGAIVVFPIALVLVRGSDLVYTRHFLIAGLFVLLLFGFTLGRWWTEGRRRVVGLAIATYVAVNGWNVVDLARDGRGAYRNAIEYMADVSSQPTVTIAGDHDFRIGMEMAYYLPRVQTTKHVEYVEQGKWPAGGPEWIVLHRESFVAQPPEPTIELGPGLRYSLAKAFPTAPLSGLHWYVYHHQSGQ